MDHGGGIHWAALSQQQSQEGREKVRAGVVPRWGFPASH